MATYTSNYGWTKPSGSDNVDISVLNNNLDDQDSTIHDAFLNMAPPFSESSTYAVDDIVLYGTGLYKCHTAVVTPGSWTGSTNWQVYKLSEGGSGGGGGTTNYNALTNKPQINSVELSGNKTAAQLGLMASDGVVANPTGQTTGTLTALEVGGTKYAVDGGSGGASDYPDLTNKPQINGVTLTGNKTTNDLGITASGVGAIPSTDKGANGGVAELDSNGKVPSSQLPSYVDDVLSYASQSAFPATGETGKIYIAEDTNKTYRWSGSAYAEISASLALGETSSTAYRGDRGKTAYDHSQTPGNPHGTTASDVGLGNVPNVSTNDQTPTFTEASTRNNIASGEKLSVILGKVQKFFNDLKTVAFSGSFSDLSNKPKINSVELSGNKTAGDLGLQSELTFDNVPTDGSNNPVKSDGIYNSEKDIYAVMGKMGAKNLIPVPYYEDTEEDRGITWTNNADGTITITGTATADSAHNLSQRTNTGKLYLPNGKYILNGCPSGDSNSTFYLEALCTKDSSSTSLGIDGGEGVEITVDGDDYGVDGAYVMVRGIVKNGYAVTNPITFKPMLRLASDTDDTYQPYAKTNRELTESYPANKVMMSDGTTSVEDALDGLTEDSSDTLSDTTYLYANAKIKRKGSVVMIRWNGLKGMTNQTTKTITGLIPQKYRPLEDIVFDLCPPSTASVLEIYRIKIKVNGDVTVYPYNGISAQSNLLTTITYLI